MSEVLWLLSVALSTTAVQQAEGTAAQQDWKPRKSGNSIPHLTWSPLLPNMQILLLSLSPSLFSNLNLLRNAQSTPGSLSLGSDVQVSDPPTIRDGSGSRITVGRKEEGFMDYHSGKHYCQETNQVKDEHSSED